MCTLSHRLVAHSFKTRPFGRREKSRMHSRTMRASIKTSNSSSSDSTQEKNSCNKMNEWRFSFPCQTDRMQESDTNRIDHLAMAGISVPNAFLSSPFIFFWNGKNLICDTVLIDKKMHQPQYERRRVKWKMCVFQSKTVRTSSNWNIQCSWCDCWLMHWRSNWLSSCMKNTQPKWMSVPLTKFGSLQVSRTWPQLYIVPSAHVWTNECIQFSRKCSFFKQMY